jgi:hypothetical protein
MIVIEPSSLDGELSNLMKGEEALRPWIEAEIQKADGLKKKSQGG